MTGQPTAAAGRDLVRFALAIVVGLVLARVLASALGEAPAAGLGALLVFWWYFGQLLRARGESPRVAWTLGAVYGALTAAFITGATILS